MRYWTSFLLFYCLISLRDSLAKKAKSMKVGGKIVGGSPVNIKRFPSAVQVYIRGDLCAGTILNSWTILTAAHCFDNSRNVRDILVQVGAQFLHDYFAPAFQVAKLRIHKDYGKKRIFACDIALLFLKKAIRFNRTNSKKAILVNHDKWMNPSNHRFLVHGWGKIKYGGPVSQKGLLMTHLHFVSSEKCGRMHNIKLTPEMFCLYGNAVRDTCKGDSGGAVMWKNMVVGITSHGDGCAMKNKPSVYTNVWYFRKWIKKHTKTFFKTYCEKKYYKGNIKRIKKLTPKL